MKHVMLLSLLALSVAPVACATTGAALVADGESVADVFDRVHTGVVTLYTVSRGPTVESMGLPVALEGNGSGVLISAEGDILTAAHVVQTAAELFVEFHDGSVAEAQIVSSDPLIDLAIVRVVGEVPASAAVAVLGDSDHTRVGSRVFAVGAPLGISHTLTVGHLSAQRVTPSMADVNELVEVLQTDASLNPGNSGGPLFDMQGRVVGIVSFISTLSGGSQGLGFAVSSNTCRERFLERPPLWSGMEFLSVSGRFAELLNVPGGGTALLVQGVVAGSPADRLGLRGGDVAAEIQGLRLLLGGDLVLAVNGVALGAPGARDTIRDRLGAMQDAEEVRVTILRAGEQRVLTRRWSDLR
jgi:S1-C subfamily serine protease